MANGAAFASLSLLEGEKHIGSASMQTRAKSSFIFTDSSSLKRLADLEKRVSQAGLYQGIARNLIKGLHTNQTIEIIATRLASAADNAYAFRNLDIVGCLGQVLSGLPLSPTAKSAGGYYQALCIHNLGRGDIEESARILERVAENASPSYKVRALMSLGANSRRKGDNQAALSLYREASHFNSHSGLSDPYTTIQTQRMFAVISSQDGNHRNALVLLENLFSLAHEMRSWQPHVYYDYLNSLAVELCEVGRLEEARNASRVALASPFAPAYPEWRETFDDIAFKQRRASRSIVAVATRGEQTSNVASQQVARSHDGVRPQPTDSHNLVHLPAPEPLDSAATNQRSEKIKGRVLDFLQWKTMMKEADAALPDKLAPDEREEMTTGEKLIRLMDLVSRDETDDEMIDRILNAVEEIVLGAQTNIS